MLRAGNSVRFTESEIEDFRKIGFDFAGTRTQADVESEVTDWVGTLQEQRPDLLEKIAVEMARVKGVRFEPRFSVVPSSDSAPQS